MQRIYLAIDLKSYYASAECAARHLDPLTTNLVVADSSRTEKTICLAVSPSLKAYGISGRARLFEVMQKVKEINANRLRDAVRFRKAVYPSPLPPMIPYRLPPTRHSNSLILLHHHGWHIMKRCRGRFMASTSSILPRRTSWFTVSMRCSSMPPRTYPTTI